MTYRNLLTLLLAVCLSAPAVAQRVDEAAVRRQIDAAASRLRTMQCDFVQTKHMRMLNDKMVSRGHMVYSQPGKLRWEYTSPYSYTFVINGTQVMMRRGGKSQVVDASQSKMFKEITRIMMNSLVGKCLSDGKEFRSTIAATPSEWVATLVPLKSSMKQLFKSIKVHFSKQQSMVTVVELTEKNGDRTVIELKNVRSNQPVNASLFTIR